MSNDLRGVIFRCTIRGGHASLATIATSEHEDRKDERMVLVIVRLGGPEWDANSLEKTQEHAEDNSSTPKSSNDQEKGRMTLMRSNIRRMCKLGNEMQFRGNFSNTAHSGAANTNAASNINTSSKDWQSWDRFVVDYYLPNSQSPQSTNVLVCQELKWDATQCQTARAKYFESPPQKQQKKQKRIAKQHKNADGIDSSSSAATYPVPGEMIDPTQKENTAKDDRERPSSRHHGGGIGKRKQGEIVADFLLWMLSTIYQDEDGSSTVSTAESGSQDKQSSPTIDAVQPASDGLLKGDNVHHQHHQHHQHHLFMERWVPLHPSLASPDKQCSSVATRNAMIANIIKQSPGNTTKNDCNSRHVTNPSPQPPHGGIIDAAGGAGHVSLALALRGVHSTVVDPRSTAGKLPGRDRKVLKKSKLESFSTYRAWFGSRPKGVDSFFREGAPDGHGYNQTVATADGNTLLDPTTLPICSMCSEDNLLPNCTAIAALHPDEATGSIIETAVEHEIPFVAVPCCVFSRLFPERVIPVAEDWSATAGGNNAIVSTYHDLIDWLVAKHPAIKVTRLPFEGSNIAVWATFK
ncbi:hypothetical protein ACHAXR_012928 [Thalassiosira sp. AJA248-18]